MINKGITKINFSEVEYCALPQLRFKFKVEIKIKAQIKVQV